MDASRAVCFCVLLLATGCGGYGKVSKGSLKVEELAEKTNVAIIKRGFDSTSVKLEVPPDEVTQFVTSRWTAGYVRLTPFTLDAPDIPRSKVKGFDVEVVASYWTVCCGPDRTPQSGDKATGSSALDEDEAKALDGALATMQSATDSWAKEKPKMQTEIMFRSKGGVSVQLVSPDSYVLRVGAAAAVLKPVKAAELKSNLESGLRVLDQN